MMLKNKLKEIEYNRKLLPPNALEDPEIFMKYRHRRLEVNRFIRQHNENLDNALEKSISVIKNLIGIKGIKEKDGK